MNEKKIGLCLSGGGHRATAFSLGVLLYLADVGVHQDIHTISSVSGGSLTSGFFATRSKSLRNHTAEEMEDSIAKLAARITGRPWFFWISLVAILLALLVWILYTTGRLHCSLSFWELQLFFFAIFFFIALFAGLSTGGTLWGWWGTWMYLGLALVSIVTGVAIWWSTVHWFLCLFITIFAFSTPLLRSHIAEMAFAATIFKGENRHATLAGLRELPYYVFCATEMHSGKHAWLTPDLVSFPYQGLGDPGRMKVQTAVQMSANFPVGFPWRFLWQEKYDVCPLDIYQLELHGDYFKARSNLFFILTDGGVYDNMATTWFEEAPRHAAIFEDTLRKSWFQEKLPQGMQPRLRKQIDAMKNAAQDCLIVVNSAEPYQWRGAWHFGIPVYGEARMLISINDRMYNSLNVIRKHRLMSQFVRQPMSGAFVSIGEAPYESVIRFRTTAETDLLFNLGLSEEDVQVYRSKALDMKMPTGEELFDELHRTIASKAVSTTLRPLSRATTSALLAHGYLSAMINCHLFLDFPIVSEIPTLSDFEQLAMGKSRKTRPTPRPKDCPCQ